MRIGVLIVDRISAPVVPWVLTFVVRHRAKSLRAVDATILGAAFARIGARLVGCSYELLEFRYEDVIDEKSLSVGRRIYYKDLARVHSWIISKPLLSRISKDGRRFAFFARKGAASGTISGSQSVVSALYLIQVARWVSKSIGSGPTGVCLRARLWKYEIQSYANQETVVLNWLPGRPDIDLKGRVKRILGVRGVRVVLSFIDTLRSRSQDRQSTSGSEGLVLADYHGQLNLENPELNSDVFFGLKSDLPRNRLLLLFRDGRDPLDVQKWQEMVRCGIKGIALAPEARKIADAPLFQPRRNLRAGIRFSSMAGRSEETGWLKELQIEYSGLYDYYVDLFRTTNARIYVNFHRFDGVHCAIADALEALGGVTAYYQRSYEEQPYLHRASDIDVMFSFNTAHADVERDSGSRIAYHITTGYVGDHRFPMLREHGRRLRQRLASHGATFVVAYFDENTSSDERWGPGHNTIQRPYEFLLRQVIDCPWLGLVLKPKKPSTLKDRLGPDVWCLLEQAEATGRCVLLRGGAIQSSYPPAYAALSADLAIHSSAIAGTAAVEAALAGTPTVILDEESWSVSEFYKLGVGRCVFQSLESLWYACEREAHGKPIEGLGDWSPMLADLDPFRDGKAAERIGNYINWMVEGLDSGKDRGRVLDECALRYRQEWGSDKVVSVNC